MKKRPKLLPNLQGREFKIYQNVQYWFIVPLVIVLIAAIAGAIYGTSKKFYGFVDIGIDFRGGTVLTVETTEGKNILDDREANLDAITEIVEANGAFVVSNQNSGGNALVVRYPNTIRVDGVQEDYNKSNKTQEMIEINNNIESGIIAKLEAKYPGSKFKATAETINATASSDLVNKAILCVGIAMLLMLIYMAFRFDLFSGIAALITQLIDILVMMSLVVLFRVQINSTLIAGLITIVSYSINNTIVMFDRVRDNVKMSKAASGRIDVQDIVNTSVKQSYKRALFTSFTTLITISILAVVGIRSLTDFALPIIFGILSGLYSSLFLSPSLWGLMMEAKIKHTSANKGSLRKRFNARKKRV